MQDFTGVPAVVDLAAMREAVKRLGGDTAKVNPLSPVDLVIDHSVTVDRFGDDEAFEENVRLEMERNHERYVFLKWGKQAFSRFSVVPPGTGICHQVNLEYLGKAVWSELQDGEWIAYPDTLVGTDSHTTMINGLGVLGWGVGGPQTWFSLLPKCCANMAWWGNSSNFMVMVWIHYRWRIAPPLPICRQNMVPPVASSQSML